MNHLKLMISTIFLLNLSLEVIHAQQAIPASGGNAAGSGGSVSYSVGQVVYTSNTGTGGSSNQGVQIPFEISVVTGLEITPNISLTYLVYPNPATDYLTLKMEGEAEVNYMAYLLDINGKLLMTKNIEINETIISMKDLAPAIYFLKILDKTKEIKTFKIIKN